MPSKLQLLPSDIAERLKELPGRVASLDGLVALWLFGSFARGEATPISDVDLAYLPDEALKGETLERFETELYSTISGTLHTDEFTFANLHQAPAYFAWRVLAGGQLLFCRDPHSVAAFAEAVYRHAPDARWLRRAGNVDFLEGIGMPEPAVDQARITEFLRLLSEDLKTLQEKVQVSKEVYLKDRDIQAVVERRLQTATESCINIGNHIIARLGLRAPQDYEDVFRILGEARILTFELVQQMVDMSKFRNLLVHVYWGIDQEQVYDSLLSRLVTLEAFVKHIVQWLKEQSGRS
ncbi:MAG: DUF86 domain-containing protein [Armatimonadota bacterium]|nr:DUF86 domain-containing protein [Armatimonadota bacterium]